MGELHYSIEALESCLHFVNVSSFCSQSPTLLDDTPQPASLHGQKLIDIALVLCVGPWLREKCPSTSTSSLLGKSWARRGSSRLILKQNARYTLVSSRQRML
jgi:hypothetical protein